MFHISRQKKERGRLNINRSSTAVVEWLPFITPKTNTLPYIYVCVYTTGRLNNRYRGNEKTCSGWSRKGRSWEASWARRRTSTCSLSRTLRFGYLLRTNFKISIFFVVLWIVTKWSPSRRVCFYVQSSMHFVFRVFIYYLFYFIFCLEYIFFLRRTWSPSEGGVWIIHGITKKRWSGLGLRIAP